MCRWAYALSQLDAPGTECPPAPKREAQCGMKRIASELNHPMSGRKK